MAKCDVYANPSGTGLLLDCQADLLSELTTRLVVPLLPLKKAPKPARRLNPVFQIEGKSYVMATQFAATVPARLLKNRIGSIAEHEIEIGNAIDMLLSGF
jgi:toxin CcdB